MNDIDDISIEEISAGYEKRLYDLQQLLEIAHSLCSTLDFHTLIESIIYTCMSQFRVFGAGIFILDDVETDTFVLGTNFAGMTLEAHLDYVIPRKHPLIKVLSEKERAFSPNALQRLLPDEQLDEIYSLNPSLIVPLLQRDRLIGILLLGERMDFVSTEEYNVYELKQILNIASLASTAINTASLLERSSIDMMTHLKLKYYFFNTLEEKLDIANKKDQKLSIVMFDVDHFRDFNDTYGHACGDYVLTSVAKIIRDSIRTRDMAGRYGGEEFTVMLQLTDEKEAMAVAERIRRKVEKSDFFFEGKHMNVTISGGVATFSRDNGESLTAKEFVELADKALYFSKRRGRNRITFANDEVKNAPWEP